MPIVNPNQPSVAVQVPVPTPARTSPQKAVQRPLLPQLPQRPQPPQLKAIIMPFTPDVRRMKRLPRKVIKYSLQWSNVRQLLKAARENPDNTTVHGEVADALDEEYPGNPIAGLIKRR